MRIRNEEEKDPSSIFRTTAVWSYGITPRERLQETCKKKGKICDVLSACIRQDKNPRTCMMRSQFLCTPEVFVGGHRADLCSICGVVVLDQLKSQQRTVVVASSLTTGSSAKTFLCQEVL